ncbi:MAG TPA: ribonuclease III, partial [Ktedonobacterales bacterium]
HPDRVLTKGGARPGDALILTKPLGAGILSTAQKNGADDEAFAGRHAAAVASMSTLNAGAARALATIGANVHACTDISGFGLLGHALEMATQSGCALHLDMSSIPLLDGAREYAAAGHVPGGTRRNLDTVKAQTTYDESINKLDRLLLADPQTSGGLFVAVAPELLNTLLAAMATEGVHAYVVGRAEEGAGLKVSSTPLAPMPERAATPTEQAEQSAAATVDPLASLEAAIGHTFKNRQLLLDAMTHRSYAYEFAAPDVISNERLEFLGDAVLALVSADQLFQQLPEAQEGDLTQLRAALVRASTLATLARRIPLGPYLRLGRGEEATGGRDRETLIASAFEAVIGALYLDAGLSATQDYLLPLLRTEASNAVAQRRVKDNKSLLQELAQGSLGITPRYVVVNQEGPSHDRIFTVEALLGELVIGRGQGRSKREAEQAAAQSALQDPGWSAPASATRLPESSA